MYPIDYTPYKLRDWIYTPYIKEFWANVSRNCNSISFLEQNPDKIDWEWLSENPKAIHLLEQNQDKIDWERLSGNPKAIHLLEQNLDKIDWKVLSSNPKAIHLLERNQDKIDWHSLSENPKAIHLIEENLDKINSFKLHKNPNAIHLLGRPNIKRLRDSYYNYCWENLSENPSIFEIDYKSVAKIIAPFKEELMQRCFHPSRLVRYLYTYNYDIGEDEYQD